MNNTIKIDQLIRSRRRTIGLQITNDAKLIVRAPLFASEDYIQKLIQRKVSWIQKKQDFFRKHSRIERTFTPGEQFLFLGTNYTLTVSEDLPKAVVLGEDLMISSFALNNARDHIKNWYKTQALEHITGRVEHYIQMTGLKYQSIRVNSATTRWGSCGHTDALNFTWRLIMTPASVIDYVVIHELMHIKQKNHSRKFWAEVANMMPGYKNEERWLKQNGHLLAWK